ncbi:MAG: hypothetical protein ACQCN6_06845 [Candidatus Bathyarchaeia archaeon]|jgi:hypothetical protein
MTQDSLEKQPEGFLRDASKLEVRIEEYLKGEELFAKQLRQCTAQLKALQTAIDAKNTAEISKLKAEAITSLSEAMKTQGVVEHGKSHLFSLYADLIVALQKIET